LRVPGCTRFDIGARYLTEWQNRLVTLRARIENVADRDYWASVGGAANSGLLLSTLAFVQMCQRLISAKNFAQGS
jgi:iron complex outermembrane receptor protein